MGFIDFFREMFTGRWAFHCKKCGKLLKTEYVDSYDVCGNREYFYYCDDHPGDCGVVGRWS